MKKFGNVLWGIVLIIIGLLHMLPLYIMIRTVTEERIRISRILQDDLS